MAKAFLRAQAALFGSYRDALRYKPVRICSFLKSTNSKENQLIVEIEHLWNFTKSATDACLLLNSSAVLMSAVCIELIDCIDCGLKKSAQLSIVLVVGDLSDTQRIDMLYIYRLLLS